MKVELIKKIWNDQVWSKVIAAGIIFILAQIGIYVWGLIINLNFIDVYKNIFKFFKDSYLEKDWFLLIIIILVFLLIIIFIFVKLKNVINNSILKKKKNEELVVKTETEIREAPTVFFHYRFCDAFPGFSNGFKLFNSIRDIQNRIKILLKKPIAFNKGEGYGVDTKPIWWFRGSSAFPIEKLEIISKKKVLLNTDEFKINKIAAYRGRSYFQDFVYFECLPDKATGLYNHDQTYIDSMIKDDRGYQEEFGIYKNKFITRQEYDDGSALIKGKPVRTIGAELRSRSLTKFNFIIAAKYSPYNCRDFTRGSGKYFGKLLRNEIEFDEFVEWMKKFPKNRND